MSDEIKLDLEKYKVWTETANDFYDTGATRMSLWKLIGEIERTRKTVGAVHAVRQANLIKELKEEVKHLKQIEQFYYDLNNPEKPNDR